MDEELGVKVTRLRRRLSVEADGVQSPTTPSTPTKKRGTRLVKPALELIDENVTENVPKKATRKSIARDVSGPTEDKPVTPARRSARIRSNTSLVLDAVQNVVDSPRARRAASRRNSQLGSDAETTATPAKQNRRGRRNSTSSVEQLAITNINEKAIVQVAEVIAEEQEKETSKIDKSADQSPTLRKSPRLQNKTRKSIDEAVKNINDKRLGNTSSDGIKITGEISPSTSTHKLAQMELTSSKKNDKNIKIDVEPNEKKNLSPTSNKLINETETKPKKSSVTNKTASEIEKDLNNEKNYRKRTKSWTITSDLSMEKDNHINILGSGDAPIKINEKVEAKSPNKSMNTSASAFNSIENKENINFSRAAVVLEAIDTVKLLEKAPSKNIEAMVFIDDSDSNSGSIGKLTIDLQNYNESQHNDGEDQCVPVVKQPTSKRSSPSESFTVEAMDIDETIPENVTINDFSDKTNSSKEDEKQSDSKPKSIASEDSIIMKEKSDKSKRTSSISQQQESKRKSSVGTSEDNNNDPEVVLSKSDKSFLDKSQRKSSSTQDEENDEKINVNTSKRKSSLTKVEPENDKRKSSINSQFEEDKIYASATKSKRKSLSETASQGLEKTSNENKSTLVLSEFKDMSENEVTNISKSPNDPSNNELSKSVNILATENDNITPSLNYLTSTPLQQKPLQKIAMPINTSIISPNVSSKITKNMNKTSPNKRASNAKSDSSDNKSDRNSKENSKMFDDEAEEASDNYESGDSRNDEERQYEENHEVVETGETLESEQEFSNDSDYEKDSFIVSSDEEDDDLLSGSGDDLSLTDNELKITKKSKKKFDERKLKQQKKASKEMYESRHKLNESDKSVEAKNKKSKRQRLETSVQESDTDDENEPKKKNRLRIDSSQELSLNNSNADESIRVKKKKTKRLSESVCEEDAHRNEREITICNQSIEKINDPLSVAVKQEPKTPQNSLDMSTVIITDNIEEVQVDSNASIMKSNETSDPLQATVANEESDSDISENMEIKANYDSVLENLNKSNNKRNKTTEISLDLNVNKKDKVKEPLVDQPNLNEVKKSKQNKSQATEKSVITEETTSPKITEVTINDDGDASDSIDMRLLFPEDSNDSETYSIRFKPDDNQQVETDDVCIPLKKTEAKTNLRESLDLNLSKNELELNTSKKKNKNRNSSQCIPETTNGSEGTNVSFFIETKGTCQDMDSSVQSNAKKNKKKHKTNDSIDNDAELTETLVGTAAPEETLLDVLVKSDKKKKKKDKSQNVSQTGERDTTNVSFFIDTKGSYEDMDTSTQNSAKKNKKKHKANVSMDNIQNDGEVDGTLAEMAGAEETPLNVSTKSDKKKKKKNKSQNVSDTVAEEILLNVSTNSDKKKKKKNKSQNVSDTVAEEILLNVSTNSDKKKKNKSQNVSDTEVPGSTNVSFFIDTQGSFEDMNSSVQNSGKKNKKKHKVHVSIDNVQNDGEVDGPLAEMAVCEETLLLKPVKKMKKIKLGVPETAPESAVNVSVRDDKKKKEKNKSLEISQTDEQKVAEETPVKVLEIGDKKKKKKNKTPDAYKIVDSAVPDETVSLKREKKKRKKPKTKTGSEQSPEYPVNISLNSDKKKNKKNKSLEVSETGENIVAEESPVNMSENSVKKKKKKIKTPDASQIADSADAVEKLVDVSVKSDKKKKKKKSFEIVGNTGEESDEAPLEVAYKSGKNNPEFLDPKPNINPSTDAKKKFKKKKKKNINAQAQKDVNSQGGPKKRKIDATSASPMDSNRNSSSQGNKKRKLAPNNEAYNASSEGMNKNQSNKKRKASEVFDAGQKKSKVFKETSFDKVHIPRLPESIVNRLNAKPQKESKKQKHVKAVATMPFQVEQAQKRKNKPSHYLEQSIYLNNSPVKQKQKTVIKNPKVLPFTPTVVTSGKGYTSTFKINVLPQETQFIAQASDMTNFKSEFLANQRIKKLRTFEHFKRQRSQKLAKF